MYIQYLPEEEKAGNDLQKALIYLAAAFSIFILAGIMIYVFYRGITSISISFLTTAPSALNNTFGILGNIINTLYIVVITLLIATPIGVGSAIYLNEYAKPGRIVRLIEFTTETLAGIPSIIFGLFGYVFFGTTLKLGIFHSDRCADAFTHGASADHQKYAGSSENRALKLPERCA